MATYIESALGDFIKTILTRGIRTLTSPKFVPYTIFLSFIVFTGTITAFIEQATGEAVNSSIKDALLFAELSAAITFIFVGIFLGRVNINLQMIILVGLTSFLSYGFYSKLFGDQTDLAILLAGIFYILWIGLVTFSTFSLFRDLFANETFGTVLFLGKPNDDGEVMFAYLAWLLAFINLGLGYFVLTNANNSNALRFTAFIIILNAILAMIPLLGIQKKNDVFFTILTSFYMFSTIKVGLLAFRTASGSGGSTSFWDTIFSLFIALYTIQGAAVKGIKIGEKIDDEDEVQEKDATLEEIMLKQEKGFGFFPTLAKLISDRGMVLVILGIVLGYHTMQIQTIFGRDNIFQDNTITSDADIVVLGYEVSLIISLLIFIIAVFLFFVFPPFKSYANPEVNRIPWAPPYEELKLVVSKIKSGELNWKGDAMKMLIGMSKDAIKAKFGRKSKSKEERISSTWSKWLGKDDKKK